MHPPSMRFSLLVLLAVTGCSSAISRPGPVPAERHSLILVSIDGFHPDYLRRGQTPVLDSLARAGVRAEWMEPSFPTKTFPNHYTLVTGLRPDRHGIIANNMRDSALGAFSMGNRDAVRDPRWWGGEPIWATVARHGLVAAPMFWPGSEAPIGGSLPAHWMPFDDDYPLEARVDSLLTWLSLPPDDRPAFLSLYTSTVDHAGHNHGPTAPEVDAALVTVDRMLARLTGGLVARGMADRVNLIVVSDHGMAPVWADSLILLDELVDLADLVVHDWGPVGMFQPVAGRTDAVYRALRGAHPALAVHRRAEVPARYRFGSHPRVPEIIAIAAPGWRITTTERASSRTDGGDHGYDNADPTMRALFIAAGPGVRSGGVLRPFSNVHVYPLMAELLRLAPAPSDGELDSVRSVLR